MTRKPTIRDPFPLKLFRVTIVDAKEKVNMFKNQHQSPRIEGQQTHTSK
jgi:hypothetical protein